MQAEAADGSAAMAKAGGTVEESMTDANGGFRLRGLQPGESYVIRVKAQAGAQGKGAGGKIERASPLAIPVLMQKNDLTGLRFVIFHRLTKFQVGVSSFLCMWGRESGNSSHLPCMLCCCCRPRRRTRRQCRGRCRSRTPPVDNDHALRAKWHLIKANFFCLLRCTHDDGNRATHENI